MSPYYLLYGKAPTVCSSVSAKMMEPVSAEDTEAAGAMLTLRGEMMQRAVVMAGDNLRIAQHRDTLRYATVRGGGYVPQLRRFAVGDFVYAQRVSGTKTLESKARREILRVHTMGAQGTLKLQGKCGGTVVMNAVNCAPCHLPGIDGTLQVGMRPASSTLACSICRELGGDASMVLCDGCDAGYHMSCLVPAMVKVPKGRWYCHSCLAIKAGDPQAVPQQVRVTEAERKDRSMDGVRVQARRGAPIGTAHYLGAQHEPGCFEVRYADGRAERLTSRQVVGRSKAVGGGQPEDV